MHKRGHFLLGAGSMSVKNRPLGGWRRRSMDIIIPVPPAPPDVRPLRLPKDRERLGCQAPTTPPAPKWISMAEWHGDEARWLVGPVSTVSCNCRITSLHARSRPKCVTCRHRALHQRRMCRRACGVVTWLAKFQKRLNNGSAEKKQYTSNNQYGSSATASTILLRPEPKVSLTQKNLQTPKFHFYKLMPAMG